MNTMANETALILDKLQGVTPVVDIDAPFGVTEMQVWSTPGLGSTAVILCSGDTHDPARRWNGWAVPRFCYEVAMLIVEWLNESEPDMAWWIGRTLAVRDAEGTCVDVIEPDQLGLYQFDGWVWFEVDPNT
jgi:hypothetical protein